MTHTGHIRLHTTGHTQVLDITAEVARIVAASGIHSGAVLVFAVGSTAGITTTEAEPGLMNHDLKRFWEGIAPDGIDYLHEATWNDDNGHAHVRASALGPSLTVPVVDRRMTLGTWQQIVFLDFDTRGRQREVVVQVIGDAQRAPERPTEPRP